MNKVVSLMCASILMGCSGFKAAESGIKGAPHEFAVLCTSADTDSSFRIYEGQGMWLRYGEAAKLFNCEQVVSLDDAAFVNSPARMMYECFEKDQVAGAEISVYRTGENGQIKASITDKKGGFEVAKMDCQN